MKLERELPMSHISIYSPRVRREATLYGITELQAYRKLSALETIRTMPIKRSY